MQEEPGPNKGTKHSSSGVEGPLLPHTIFAILLDSMQCLLLEAKPVILEELRVQRHSFFYHCCHWCYVRRHLLEERGSNVSQLDFSILDSFQTSSNCSLPTTEFYSLFFFFSTDIDSRICWICWELLMLLCFSSELWMVQQFNLWLQSREQFSTVKELQECIQSCPMHLHR